MKCHICFEICSDVESTLTHLKNEHTRCKPFTFFQSNLYLVEYLKLATNGFEFIDQCRKCGLAGARKKHYGPAGTAACDKLKSELKRLGIKPLIPWFVQERGQRTVKV